jgi:hypothetical protein
VKLVFVALAGAVSLGFSNNALASTTSAAPSLSAFYAHDEPLAETPPAALVPEYQERYHRGRRLYNTGMVVGISGMVVFGPSFVGFISSAFGGNEPVAAVTGLLSVASAGAALTGLFAANIGAANADVAVAHAFGYRPNPWLGVAGITVFAAGVALVPFTQGYSLIGSAVGGFGLAAAQMARPKSGLRNHGVSWYVAPTTQGVMVGLTL